MTGFFKDLFAGDFTKVWEDVVSGYNRLPQEVKDFLIRLEDDGENMLQTLAQAALQDVVAGGFTTASFVAAGKDIVAKGLAQGKTILLTDAIAQLNILAAGLNPANKV